MSISEVIYDEDDQSNNCQDYPNKDYESYGDCDAVFIKTEYKTENCTTVKSTDITPIFTTKNLDEVPNSANCTSFMQILHGHFSGKMASPCRTPLKPTQF